MRGHAEGWLRILRASDLLELVRSDLATELMWRESRVSAVVWRRDFLPALHRYAEYVQLMPASESHHHAHVGGLLSHTLEMTLAAMRWRNGHFFPEGAPVEEMDAQRDEWTYVVFFAALLHDVGKVMTDLRVFWSCQGMDAPLRWVPMSGPLPDMVQRRLGGEYLVEFTPKSARDYQAHSRLSMILLQQIAPPTALSFLARRPLAFEALSQYLAGTDKTSLLAGVVRRADQASTQKALSSGSRARFATSTSVPLIDLLMQSIKDMLKNGTALPLNRSGAAGWVFDGAIWFVAKRLADSVRQHVKQHHPEESIPGDNKNDRLFDTWQEYNCIQLNPHSGQAVWYVQVHGGFETAAIEEGDDAPQGDEAVTNYSHSLTVLRFPLDKLYADASLYPPAMVGRIQVQQKRVAAVPDQETGATAAAQPFVPGEGEAISPSNGGINNTVPTVVTTAVHADSPAKVDPNKAFRSKPEPVLRAPSFGPSKAGPAKPPKASSPSKPIDTPVGEPALPVSHHGFIEPAVEPLQMGGPDGFSAKEKWLDFEDDAAVFKAPLKPVPPIKVPQPSSTIKQQSSTAPSTAKQPKTATKAPAAATSAPPVRPMTPLPVMPEPPAHRPLLLSAGQPAMSARTESLHRFQHAPVLLTPFLPELPHESAGKKTEPTPMALEFITWLQQGLANRELKYNETGAMIHFTAEGMALVSPLIFKTYAATQDLSDTNADAHALQVQREVFRAGWHLMGPGKSNILKYQVLGRGGIAVGKLSAVVLIRPERWVMPVPPSNPVLQITSSEK